MAHKKAGGSTRNGRDSESKRLGVKHYGGGYGTATWSREGDRVVVQGLVKASQWGVIATLPAGYRPDKQLIFNLNNHRRTVRVDVKTMRSLRGETVASAS